MKRAPDRRMLDRPGVFVRSMTEALAVLRSPAAVLVFLPLLACDLALVWALGRFPGPPAGAAPAPLFAAAGGESGLHYPAALAALPAVWSWLRRGLAWAAGGFALAGLVAVLPGVFRGRRATAGEIASGWRRVPAIWLATLPALVLADGASVLADRLPATSVGLPSLRDLYGLALIGAGLLVRALLLYVGPEIVLRGAGPLGAIRGSLVAASGHFGTTLAIVVAAGLPGAAVRWLRGDPRAIVADGDPEAVVVWVAGESFAVWIGALLLVAASTRLWLHLADPDPAPGGAGPARDGGDA